jgi:hypothetical protein
LLKSIQDKLKNIDQEKVTEWLKTAKSQGEKLVSDISSSEQLSQIKTKIEARLSDAKGSVDGYVKTVKAKFGS